MLRVPRSFAIAAVVISAVLSSGCGYALAGRGTFLPASIKRIGIPVFKNRTPVFNLETIVTQSVRSEFIGRGRYQILPEDVGVDAVLVGEVTAVSVAPASFNPQQLASRYAITMAASIQLKEVGENKILWENPSVTFRQEYEVTTARTGTDPNAFFGQETNALERVSSEFARTIVSSILEAF